MSGLSNLLAFASQRRLRDVLASAPAGGLALLGTRYHAHACPGGWADQPITCATSEHLAWACWHEARALAGDGTARSESSESRRHEAAAWA
ncbi:hypothetical protein LCGC14_2881910 [marine sediment metagenome]|uniref:Uncharacterized protein n=1 Tax=marine sediment metagenome TaxID=412755 RepID=A0A0F9A7T8_9ZZZZ